MLTAEFYIKIPTMAAQVWISHDSTWLCDSVNFCLIGVFIVNTKDIILKMKSVVYKYSVLTLILYTAF